MPTSLLDQVEVIDWGSTVALLKSTTQELDQFEKDHGVKLPLSYRSFAQRFGAGELAGHYRIAVPSPADNPYSLARYNRDAHGPEEDAIWEGQAPPEVIPRLLFFANTIGGEYFAWDPQDVKDPSESEYAVLWFPRSLGGEIVANSFHEFIEDYCLNQHREDGWVPRLEFAPFSRDAG